MSAPELTAPAEASGPIPADDPDRSDEASAPIDARVGTEPTEDLPSEGVEVPPGAGEPGEGEPEASGMPLSGLASAPPAEAGDAAIQEPPRWWQRRPRWFWPAGLVITFAIGVGLGVAGSVADPTKSEEYISLVEERDAVQDARDDAQGRATTAESQLRRYVGQTNAREAAFDQRESDLDTREAGLDQRQSELDQRQAGLDQREAAITATEQRIAATQIHEGVWTVGVDIEPGTYRTAAPVTDMCYWAIYRTGTNLGDIIENDIVTGGFPSVTLRAGQDFKTQDCGVWNKQ